ncbi:MAG: universal stress protein [Chloroflexi bacterium]|nr:universal stress protein [Chloroflexota bacterium]
MLQNILLPLDGSPLAELAISYATILARRAGADIVLVQAVQAHTPPGVDQTDAELEVMGRAQAYLQMVTARLEAEHVRSSAHVYYDDAAHAILDAAERQSADLIVMSTHGRTGIGRMLYGSVADLVLRHATVPVVLVPASAKGGLQVGQQIDTLLIPLDGSELAEEALASAENLPLHRETRITLLRVIEPPAYPLYGDGYTYIPYDEETELAQARQYVDQQVSRLQAAGRHAMGRVVVGQPAGVITSAARELHPDLIVMATHGHGGLSRLILGSVATSVLRQSSIPLLLTRPSALHAEEPEPCVHREGDAEAQDGAARPRVAVHSDEEIELRVSRADLYLIECGLKALAYAPGYDYEHVTAARALARRLEEATPSMTESELQSRAEPMPVP